MKSAGRGRACHHGWMTSLAGKVALVTGGDTAGIAVNELIPGPMRTQGLGDSTERDDEAEQRWSMAGEWLKEPAEVARLALFVANLPPHGPTG